MSFIIKLLLNVFIFLKCFSVSVFITFNVSDCKIIIFKQCFMFVMIISNKKYEFFLLCLLLFVKITISVNTCNIFSSFSVYNAFQMINQNFSDSCKVISKIHCSKIFVILKRVVPYFVYFGSIYR